MFNTGNCPSVPIVANLDGNNNGNNWNDGSWLWFLIVVFAIFGGWGNGFGGFGGGTNGGVGNPKAGRVTFNGHIGSIPILSVSVVQVHISEAVG